MSESFKDELETSGKLECLKKEAGNKSLFFLSKKLIGKTMGKQIPHS